MEKPISWINVFPLSLIDCEEEIKYLFKLVMTREGRWKGQTTQTFLIKNPPPEISKDKLKILFKTLPKETSFFVRKSTSIILTEDGKKESKSILS